MPVWDPARYLQFADDRSRPFLDLIGRVHTEPRTITDLGCGPGQLTAVLRARWPDAHIHGIDSSQQMLDRAVADNADQKATYELADVTTWTPDEPVDLIVSNALFQWVPDQLDVIGRLSQAVRPGGAFALQVPNNYRSPSHTLLRDIAAQEPYAEHTAQIVSDRGIEPASYLSLFLELGWTVDVWETTYFHVLAGDDPVLDWVSGTGARPYLQALPDHLRDSFVATYRAALRGAYAREPWGTVFPFRRTLVVAQRGHGLR